MDYCEEELRYFRLSSDHFVFHSEEKPRRLEIKPGAVISINTCDLFLNSHAYLCCEQISYIGAKLRSSIGRVQRTYRDHYKWGPLSVSLHVILVVYGASYIFLQNNQHSMSNMNSIMSVVFHFANIFRYPYQARPTQKCRSFAVENKPCSDVGLNTRSESRQAYLLAAGLPRLTFYVSFIGSFRKLQPKGLICIGPLGTIQTYKLS